MNPNTQADQKPLHALCEKLLAPLAGLLALACLAPGDRIVLIDGDPASELSLDQVRDLLCQPGHSPVLVVERLGRKVEVQLRLRRML